MPGISRVSTFLGARLFCIEVGLDEERVREYIRHQEEMFEQKFVKEWRHNYLRFIDFFNNSIDSMEESKLA